MFGVGRHRSRPAALGAGWTSDGPGAGYFPFYIGLIIVHLERWASSTRRCSARRATRGTFVDREQLKRVLSVLLPAAVYVLAVMFLGLYVASAIYIAAVHDRPGQVLAA